MTSPDNHNHIWNGHAWVPDPGSSGSVSGTVAVNNFPATQPVSGTVAVSGTVPVSGTVAVSGTTPVSGTVAVNNFPGTQPVSGTVAVSGTAAVSMAAPPGGTTAVSMAAAPGGTTAVSMAAAPGGTTAVSMAAAPGGTTAVSMAAPATPISTATGALTINRVTSVATTNGQVIKGSAGRLYKCHIANGSATVKFLKLYNKVAAPTVGTDIPSLVVLLPAGTMTPVDLTHYGMYFSLGIGLGITGAMADTDTTAVAVGDVTATFQYL